MRVLLKAQIDSRTAIEATRAGTLQKRVGALIDRLKPEATYFYAEGDKRTMLLVFDTQDPSQLPPTLETLGAETTVSLTPVMTPEDLQAGLSDVRGSEPRG